VNTTPAADSPFGRRRRRQYTAEFKAQAVAACQRPGVSVAAIALIHQVNANLLRRWVSEAEGVSAEQRARRRESAPSSLAPVPVATAIAPTFVPIQLEEDRSRPSEIRIEIQRGSQSVSVCWPTSAASECAAWLRELLK
jgi:transposase-like protein